MTSPPKDMMNEGENPAQSEYTTWENSSPRCDPDLKYFFLSSGSSTEKTSSLDASAAHSPSAHSREPVRTISRLDLRPERTCSSMGKQD